MDAHQKTILSKLFIEQCIGKHHITETNLLKGTQKHYRGELKTALNQLVKQNYVIKHPTTHGLAYSINQTRTQEIHELLKTA